MCTLSNSFRNVILIGLKLYFRAQRCSDYNPRMVKDMVLEHTRLKTWF